MTLTVIEGGLPPEREWTEAEIRRVYQPAIKALPFIKLKPNAEPEWAPESYWKVSQTRSRNQDLDRGAQYALTAVAAMRADGRNVLSNVFRGMIDAGVERKLEAQKAKRRHPKRDLVMTGFLNQLAKMFSPKDGGEFVEEMDDAISNAEFLLHAIDETDYQMRGLLRSHIKTLQQFRERLSVKPGKTLARGSEGARS